MRGTLNTDAWGVSRIALPGFVLLTFTLTWAAWLAPSALATPGSPWFGVGGPIFLLGVFAPALVSVALTAYDEGRSRGGASPGTHGQVLEQVRVHLYLFAVGYMAATKLLAALIYRIATGAWPTFGHTPLPLMLGAILVSTWVQAGEEVGWRGYALPRLARHLGPTHGPYCARRHLGPLAFAPLFPAGQWE